MFLAYRLWCVVLRAYGLSVERFLGLVLWLEAVGESLNID